MALIKCPECNHDVSTKAISCPNCGYEISENPYVPKGLPSTLTSNPEIVPTEKSRSSTWKPILLTILIIVLTLGYLYYQFNWEGIEQDRYTGISNDDDYITKSEYNEIEYGMTYSQVVSIIGSEGELSSSSAYGDYDIKIYSWWGKGSLGANAMITFENGVVTCKGQTGLE